MPFGASDSAAQIPPPAAKHVWQSVSCEEFQESTAADFKQFLDELKRHSFDVIILLHKWVQYISKYWTTTCPTSIQELYLKIYIFNL